MAALAALSLALASSASADSVSLLVDTAPNVNGSPDYVPWRDAAFADSADGTFQNMRNGAYPGTTNFLANEAIVYSTMDKGQRLHWIYWLPGESVASLNGRFQVRNLADWDGVTYTFDSGGNYLVDDGTNGWAQPGAWVNYDSDGDTIADGVIGTFGNAWWAYDDLAPLYNTDANPFNEVDQADIDQMAADMYQYQTFWRGEARIMNNLGQWETFGLTANLVAVVPTPGAAVGGLAMMGLIVLRRRRGMGEA
jgi:hypothetical protein